MAADTAPGLLRCSSEAFGAPPAVTWGDVDREIWGSVWADAVKKDKRAEMASSGEGPTIFVNDLHRGTIELAVRSAGVAKVHRMIDFSSKDVMDYTPAVAPDMAVTNPPWDIRLEGANHAWEKLGKFAKSNLNGRSIWALSGNPDVVQYIGMRESTRIAVSAAGMDLRFLRYDVH